MDTKSLFQIPNPLSGKTVTINFEGQPLQVPAGINVAAALLANGIVEFRSSVVSGSPRAPFCMMGVCFECLIEIDGVPSRQSCLVGVQDGMQISRQNGGKKLRDDNEDKP